MEIHKRSLKTYKSFCSIQRTFNLYPGHNSTEQITFYRHEKMIIGIQILVNDQHGCYWNDTKEVLLDAVYNGNWYTAGLDKFKSLRSVRLRANNFIKYIIADNQ